MCRIGPQKHSTDNAALWTTLCREIKSIFGHSKSHSYSWDERQQRRRNSPVHRLLESVSEEAAAADEHCEWTLQMRIRVGTFECIAAAERRIRDSPCLRTELSVYSLSAISYLLYFSLHLLHLLFACETHEESDNSQIGLKRSKNIILY